MISQKSKTLKKNISLRMRLDYRGFGQMNLSKIIENNDTQIQSNTRCIIFLLTNRVFNTTKNKNWENHQ